jgi:hypothetical protein
MKEVKQRTEDLARKNSLQEHHSLKSNTRQQPSTKAPEACRPATEESEESQVQQEFCGYNPLARRKEHHLLQKSINVNFR